MNALLLSAYAAGSHVYWQRVLQGMFSDWRWQSLTLPPRHFSWRVRGNPLFWSQAETAVLESPHDILIATSMVDLATLRGQVPGLAAVPTLLYFHENQFDYPSQRQPHGLLEAQMVSLYSALAADCLAFNSHYNRDSFLAGCSALLARLPDYVPGGVVEGLAAKSRVLPVPVDLPEPLPGPSGLWSAREEKFAPLRLVWVGRLEHDKGGDGLLQVIRSLDQQGLAFELAVVGQQFREVPEAFMQIRECYGERLVHMGYLPSRQDYLAVLAGADIVLSTAQHEFQGLAVMEAVGCGCLPVLPARQAYPEYFSSEFLYDSDPDDPQEEARSAARLIVRFCTGDSAARPATPSIAALGRAGLQGAYAAALSAAKDSH